jgi:hypothetical protein
MLAGPKRAVSGPNEPPPVGPGHRGQLARLIRERPVFVNVAERSAPGPSKRRNLWEYINVTGGFLCEDGGSPSKSAIADLDNCLIAELGYSRVRLRALDTEPADISDP